MTIEARLAQLGFRLPEPFRYPAPNRVGCVRVGSLLFTSGHPPSAELGGRIQGKVDGDLSEEEAYRAAATAALNILASVKQSLGSLDGVVRVVKVTGMVNSSPGFTRQFAVVDGASDLFFNLWGPDAGQHTRTAVGMAELPRGYPIEVEAIFEVALPGARLDRAEA